MGENTMRRLYVLLVTFLVSLFCVHSLCLAEYRDLKEIGIKIDLPADYKLDKEKAGKFMFFTGDENALYIYYGTADKIFVDAAAADIYAKTSDSQFVELLKHKKDSFANSIVEAITEDGFFKADILSSEVIALSNGEYLRCDLRLKHDVEQDPARMYHTKRGKMFLYFWFYFLDDAKPVAYTDKLISSISFYGPDVTSQRPPVTGQGGKEGKTDKQVAQATAKPAPVEQAQPAAKGDTTSGSSAAKSNKTVSGLEGMLTKGLVGGIAALIIKLLMLGWDRLKDSVKK